MILGEPRLGGVWAGPGCSTHQCMQRPGQTLPSIATAPEVACMSFRARSEPDVETWEIDPETQGRLSNTGSQHMLVHTRPGAGSRPGYGNPKDSLPCWVVASTNEHESWDWQKAGLGVNQAVLGCHTNWQVPGPVYEARSQHLLANI